MKDNLNNNKYSLLNIKIKYKWFIFISLIVFISLIITSIHIKTYDSYKYKGVALDNKIYINVNSDTINKVIKSDFIKINNKKEKFSILSVGNLQYDEVTFTNYQSVIISTSSSYIDNLSIDVTFYNNKQRIITKVINLLK